MRGALLVVLLLATTAFTVDAQSSSGPDLTTIETMDMWRGTESVPDGRIDTIRLVFDRAVAEDSLRISELDVAGRTILGYSMPTESQVLVRIEEAGFDTASLPTVRLKSGHGWTGLTGLPATQSGAVVDKAPPVLVSARALPGSTAVNLVFSEALASLAASGLTYQDQAAGGATAISSVAGSGAAWTVTLDAAVAAADMDTDRIRPQSTVTDGAGNGAVTDALALHAARALEARANIGSDQVTVRFNVPVTGASEQAFDVVYDNPPAEPIAGVSAASQPNPFQVQVQLTDAVRASDVRTTEPARLQILGDQIRHTASDANIPFASLPLVDKTPPRLTSVHSEDADRNGYIDGVRLTWNEPVAAICWEGAGEEGIRVEDRSLDLAPGEVPAVDGLSVLVPVQEAATLDPDTGALVVFSSIRCGDGRAPFTDLAQPANEALDVRIGAIDEQDGAAPAIIEGITRDQDGDGALDAYELTFSEAMETGATALDSWSVEGHDVTTASWDDADTLILGFSEVDLTEHMGDTGELPGIDHAGDVLLDLAGQALRGFQGGGFTKTDGAFPVVTQAFGDEGSQRLRLVFSEAVEAPTDAENDPAGPGRGIREQDLAYQNAGGGNTGIVRVDHGKGDRVAFLVTAQPLEASDFGTGGDRVLPLQGHVRESNTKPAAQRSTLASQFISFIEKDVDAPGMVPEGAWTVTSHNATYTFDAPADDAGDVASGPPSSYQVHVNATAFTELDATGFEALEKVGALTFQPAFAAPGETQRVTLDRLCPGTTYHPVLAAEDEDANLGAPHLAESFTLLQDLTAPVGELTFLSTTYLLNDTGAAVSTHLVGEAVAWTGATDPESCDLRYYWALSEQPTHEISAFDNLTREPATNITLPEGSHRPVHLYLHVAAASDHNAIGPQATYPIHLIQPAECSPDNIVAPDLDVVHEGGFTLLTWDELETELPEGFALEGYQIWYQRSTGKAWELRAELDLPLEELKFIDDLKVDSAARYLVTGAFTDELCRFAVDEDGELIEDSDGNTALDGFEGTRTVVVAPEPAVPTWAWVTLVSISLLVVGGVVLFYGMRRTKLDESWLEDDEPDPDHSNPFGADPIEDLGAGEGAVEDDPFAPAAAGSALGASGGDAPVMDIACPACTHNFQVQGHRPLQISCPNCHASGVLE